MSLTIDKALLLLRDFLVVWIGQILYYNHVYDAEVFEKRKYLDVIVYQCRVPDLNNYLISFANSMIKVLVEKSGGGKVHEVVVIVYDETNLHVQRRYVVDFGQFVGLSGQILSLDFLEKDEVVHAARISVPDMTLTRLYTSMRSAMFLHLSELRRTEIDNPNLFYKLLLNVDGSVNLGPGDSDWIRLTSETDTRATQLVPVGEVCVGFMLFDMHNEYIA